MRKISLFTAPHCEGLIRRLDTGEYRLYAKVRQGKVVTRKMIGTFSSLEVAKMYAQ